MSPAAEVHINMRLYIWTFGDVTGVSLFPAVCLSLCGTRKAFGGEQLEHAAAAAARPGALPPAGRRHGGGRVCRAEPPLCLRSPQAGSRGTSR